MNVTDETKHMLKYPVIIIISSSSININVINDIQYAESVEMLKLDKAKITHRLKRPPHCPP